MSVPGREAMPESMRVALVIPCFNDGDLVREAVASVDEPEPVEVVVVDDGSYDERTIEALRALESEGTLVVHQANAGPSAARMAGVRSTTAPYVFCLDADDLLEQGALGALADILDADPGASFAFGDFRMFGDYNVRIPLPEFDAWTVMFRDFWGGNAHLFRRSDLLEAGGWTFFDGYEGWDLLMTLAERGKRGVHAGRVVYARRTHGARREAASRSRHQELYAQLKRRHSSLFARKDELRRRHRPSLVKRVTYPILLGARPLPMALYGVASRVKRLYYTVNARYGR